MNRFEKVMLVAAILITWYTAGGTRAAWDLLVVRAHLSWPTTLAVITSWLLANYAVLAIVVLFWRLSRQARRPWIFHALLLPATWLATWLGDSMLLDAIGWPDFDAMIGAPILPGMLLLPIALFGYLAAALATRTARTNLAPQRSADAPDHARVDVTQAGD